MPRKERKISKEFKQYMEMIVNHPNYNGYPYRRKEDGSIVWVATRKSPLGKRRVDWLNEKRISLGIPREQGWISSVAYAIHPTKSKPCQVCGTVLSLEYIYLNKSLIKKLEKFSKFQGKFTNLTTIYELLNYLGETGTGNPNEFIFKLFNIKALDIGSSDKTIEKLLHYGKEKKYLGPGAMSNAPDRMDGYHSYNRCCRAKEDTGRHSSNLRRYGDDRRAYENWAEGNWKAANRLMKEFNKHGVSADHIGPISLGFYHRPRFQPMSVAEQATKNNRMSLSDVQILLEDELNGQDVISWHSKPLWNRLKNNIHTDSEAVTASHIMRKNMHIVLSCLADLKASSCIEFLKWLLEPQLQYSYFDYRFVGFDPKTGTYKNMITREVNGRSQINNAMRYTRISLESLDKYIEKTNRKFQGSELLQVISHDLEHAITQAKSNRYDSAKKMLLQAFEKIAGILENEYINEIRHG